MPIAVGLAVAGGVMSGVSARSQSKQATKNAAAERDWNAQQMAAAKELEQIQLQEYKDIQVPYNKDMQKLWEDYGRTQQTEQYKIFSEQGIPAQREMATQLREGLTQPLQLPQEVWDKIWQGAREKSMGEYAPLEQRTSQRLAASGGIGGGPAESLFKDIELSKAKSIESLAINQAISEWTEKKAAKQQSFENVFRMLGYPSAGVPSTPTSMVGQATSPYVATPYQTSGWAEGIGTTIENVSKLYGSGMLSGGSSSGGASRAPVITGGQGGVKSYDSNYGNVWSPYKVG